ncbi:MAG TPA: hypothetical protein VIM99_05130 [Blastocatellia bacterium]
MNCKQIREEIDTGSRRDLRGGVRSHLNDCPDCRRYSDETMSLLRLLGAQPRVEVPADFEFRLRARLARAQSLAESDRRGFLRKIRPGTFSWGRMAAATAAIAVVITVSTFHFQSDDPARESVSAGAAGADNIAANPQSIRTEREGGEALDSGTEMPAAASAGMTAVKFTSRRGKVGTAQYSEGEAEILSKEPSMNDFADIDGSTLLYNPSTKRLLNDRSRFYGAETVSISLSKPASVALTF